jgi:hypothetical protein
MIIAQKTPCCKRIQKKDRFPQIHQKIITLHHIDRSSSRPQQCFAINPDHASYPILPTCTLTPHFEEQSNEESLLKT